MIRKLTVAALIGVVLGALALGVSARLRVPVEQTEQTPADYTPHHATIRDLFP